MEECNIRKKLENISKTHKGFLAGSNGLLKIFGKICHETFNDIGEGLIVYEDFLCRLSINQNNIENLKIFYSKLQPSNYNQNMIDFILLQTDLSEVNDIKTWETRLKSEFPFLIIRKREKRTRYAVLTFLSTNSELDKLIYQSTNIKSIEYVYGQFFQSSLATKVVIIYKFVNPRNLNGLLNLIPFKDMWDVNCDKKKYLNIFNFLEKNSIIGTFGTNSNLDAIETAWETVKEKNIRNKKEKKGYNKKYYSKNKDNKKSTETLKINKIGKIVLTKEEIKEMKRDEIDDICISYGREVLNKEYKSIRKIKISKEHSGMSFII